MSRPLSSLGHVPATPWRFDGDTTAVFDDMLRRSIPAYVTMRELVFDVGRAFVRPGTDVVDLGCSRGEALAPFVEAFGDTVRSVGVEVSPPMLDAARRRFADLPVELLDLDLRRDYPDVRASLSLLVLTLQFTPVDVRGELLRRAYERTVPGGGLLLVEKVAGSSTGLDDLFVDLYHGFKRRSGYTADEVERKRLSLQGVLVPLTAPENERLLREAGFAEVDCFWRWLNFAGWVAVKRA